MHSRSSDCVPCALPVETEQGEIKDRTVKEGQSKDERRIRERYGKSEEQEQACIERHHTVPIPLIDWRIAAAGRSSSVDGHSSNFTQQAALCC